MDNKYKELVIKLLSLRYQAKYGLLKENMKEYKKVKAELKKLRT